MTHSSKSSSQFPEREPDLTATDPYRVLGISSTATQVEIKRAYFALIRQYPPETDADTFKVIRGAYEKIKDTQRRSETDIFLPQPPPEWTASIELPEFDTKLYTQDVLTALRNWGDLGRTNFETDFKEIDL